MPLGRHEYDVYVMANESRTIYTGVTSDLQRRAAQHKSGDVPGFTTRYGLKKLVSFESCPDIRDAIAREKQIVSRQRYGARWTSR